MRLRACHAARLSPDRLVHTELILSQETTRYKGITSCHDDSRAQTEVERHLGVADHEAARKDISGEG